MVSPLAMLVTVYKLYIYKLYINEKREVSNKKMKHYFIYAIFLSFSPEK